MHRGLRDRPSSQAIETIHQHLALYATAAMAAGVSMLTLAQPAAGEVVVTHKTIPILPRYIISANVPLDINGDGVTDVSFGFTSFGPYSIITANLTLKNIPGNEVITKGSGPSLQLVSALTRGMKVGRSDHFDGASYAVLEQSSQVEKNHSMCVDQKQYGHWEGNNPDRFVGVKFQISGQTHYGWVRINVTHSVVLSKCRGISATITAYAYETVANKPITIGSATEMADEPQAPNPSLGMLAMGTDGLTLWRREEHTIAEAQASSIKDYKSYPPESDRYPFDAGAG